MLSAFGAIPSPNRTLLQSDRRLLPFDCYCAYSHSRACRALFLVIVDWIVVIVLVSSAFELMRSTRPTGFDRIRNLMKSTFLLIAR
jgi:hypothetical protein